MRLVLGRNTKPEMIVRHIIHSMGYRYRLHAKDLPGKPDIVFRPRRKAIFVNGCFWHRHSNVSCKLSRLPKTRLDFWLPKLEGNRLRDEKNLSLLQELGWNSLIIWECELKDTDALARGIKEYIEG